MKNGVTRRTSGLQLLVAAGMFSLAPIASAQITIVDAGSDQPKSPVVSSPATPSLPSVELAAP
ncbi:MAG TPA: hypothetical protein PK156_14480, partial [Polyangium sp.]|nr:hypothetical protein [Polyangium sp.]